MRDMDYGKCDICNSDLEAEIFLDTEYGKYGIPTGRVRQAVGVLYCPYCGKRYCVDDTFDGPWFYLKGGQINE